MTIPQLLNLFIDRRIRMNAILTMSGVVKSVDEANRVATVTINNADYAGIALQGTMALNNGFVQIPTVGSQVGVTFYSQTSGFISCFSALDKILIDTTLLQFNGGENGGMVVVPNLVTKLNKLEDDLNNLKTVFKTTWIVAPMDGGAALKAAAATWAGQSFTDTKASDIEETAITH